MIRILLLAGAITALVPSTVFACGGFFCDNAMPVEQSGENIVFAMEDDGTITVHVQIFYEGPSERFAWILPAPSVPELGVGTNLLFTQLGQTAPQFMIDTRTEGVCASEPECEYEYHDASVDVGASFDGGSGPVTVELEVRVGPYDAVVLSSNDAEALVAWLRDNSYDIPESATPLIAYYAEMDMQFVALRLQKDKATGDIVPLTMNFEGEIPMIPIRLTAIAARPDMPITAWVLGDTRVKPMNFAAVDFDYNQVELWTDNAYERLATEAIDAAGGRAFITEFAGPTPAIVLGVYELSAEGITDPESFLDYLQGLALNQHPGLLPVLQRVLPPPEGVEARAFYNCIARGFCPEHDEYLAEVPFDGVEAIAELERVIMAPRREAEALFGRHPQLTRLFTTMSPAEMTEDPAFIADAAVGEVDNIHTAVRVTECDSRFYEIEAPQSHILPNGSRVASREGTIVTPLAYCESRGATLSNVGTRPPAGPGVPDFEGDDDGCSAAESGLGSGGILSILALLFLARRKRRLA